MAEYLEMKDKLKYLKNSKDEAIKKLDKVIYLIALWKKNIEVYMNYMENTKGFGLSFCRMCYMMCDKGDVCLKHCCECNKLICYDCSDYHYKKCK